MTKPWWKFWSGLFGTDNAPEMRRLAESGNAESQTRMGQAHDPDYPEVRGVTKDYNEAVRWYRLAAEQGNAEAQFNLGVLAGAGHGMPRDLDAARHWLERAAKQGHEKAQVTLECYDQICSFKDDLLSDL